jgi:uncharacterized protein (TIGR03067 family)
MNGVSSRWAVPALLLLAAGVAAAGEREEQLRLQGNWEIVELGYVGGTNTASKLTGRVIPIKGDKLEYSAAATYVLKLAPTREPREVDITIILTKSKTKGEPKTYKGIYKLEGDTFTIHFALTGERPKNFTDGADTKVRLMKFKRVNQPKKD